MKVCLTALSFNVMPWEIGELYYLSKHGPAGGLRVIQVKEMYAKPSTQEAFSGGIAAGHVVLGLLARILSHGNVHKLRWCMQVME